MKHLKGLLVCCGPSAEEYSEALPESDVPAKARRTSGVPAHLSAALKNERNRKFAPILLANEYVPLPETAWHVARVKQLGNKLIWVHESTGETTWRQPPPPLRRLPPAEWLHAGMASMTGTATRAFMGAPPDARDPRARTGIVGIPPNPACVRRTCAVLSAEHELYPPSFWAKISVHRILLCEDLHYNSQRRRDVPDLASGCLYVDVGDRAPRRQRHSFHHELWHMVDYHLLGNAFDGADAPWSEFNPPGFSYGSGGKHMRADANASQLSSAPSAEFLNRYATSAVAEDKAEIWAALMCYEQVISSPALRSKSDLLKSRIREICPEMDDA